MKLFFVLLLSVPMFSFAQNFFPGDDKQLAKIIHADSGITPRENACAITGHVLLVIEKRQYSCDSAVLIKNLLRIYNVTKTDPPSPFKQCACDNYIFDLKTGWMTCNCDGK